VTTPLPPLIGRGHKPTKEEPEEILEGDQDSLVATDEVEEKLVEHQKSVAKAITLERANKLREKGLSSRAIAKKLGTSPRTVGRAFQGNAIQLPNVSIISISFSDELLAKLDQHVDRISKIVPGLEPSRADAIRSALIRGLKAFDEDANEDWVKDK
jgi:hypothetical protein